MTLSPRALQRTAAPRLILASASPARARLLAAAGLAFEQRPATVDEEAVRAALQAEQVRAAGGGDGAGRAQGATGRAGGAAGRDRARRRPDPRLRRPLVRQARGSGPQARAQLEALAGRAHELATAVVGFRGGARIWHSAAQARLWLRPCSAAFLDQYLAAVGEQALASVGAYQLEGPGAQLFARVEGDHFAIQGLPLLEVLEFLREQGVLAR